jgi:hypothetical protein
MMMIMIEKDKYGALVGIRFVKGNRSTKRKPVLVPFSHLRSHITRSGIEPGPPLWKVDD